MLLKFSISVNLRFQKTKTEAPLLINLFLKKYIYLFKHVSQLLLPIWSVLLEYLHHFYVVIFYRVFLRCLFLCVFVCGFHAVLLLFLFFSLLFSFLAKICLTVKLQPLRCWIKNKSNNCVVGIDIEDSILLTGTISPTNFIEQFLIQH